MLTFKTFHYAGQSGNPTKLEADQIEIKRIEGSTLRITVVTPGGERKVLFEDTAGKFNSAHFTIDQHGISGLTIKAQITTKTRRH